MTSAWPTLRREIGTEGPRAADDVWARYVRPRRWPEWAPQVRSVAYLRERRAGFGAGAQLVVDGVGGRCTTDLVTHRRGHRGGHADPTDDRRLRSRGGRLPAGCLVGPETPGALSRRRDPRC